MAIILSAIAATLGIIRPSLDELDEQIELEAISASLITFDQSLRALMLGGTEGTVQQAFNLGFFELHAHHEPQPVRPN